MLSEVEPLQITFACGFQARKVHPDKNPNDPLAAQNFQVSFTFFLLSVMLLSLCLPFLYKFDELVLGDPL